MSDEVMQAFATLRRHLPASLRAQGAALEAAWFNGGPLHRRTRETTAPEGVDAADEQDIAKAAREYLAVTEGRAVTFVEGLARAALVRAVEAQDDPFGTTCIDCGEAIDDRRPSGTTADGDPIHTGCGDDDALADELTAAQAANQRVRELHVSSLEGRWCATCRGPYPCPTVRALDGDTTGCEH